MKRKIYYEHNFILKKGSKLFKDQKIVSQVSNDYLKRIEISIVIAIFNLYKYSPIC